MPAAKPEPKKETKTASATCPGHPDALGTERVLTIDPSEFQELGIINYKQTLPLKDHEVVLTFDDGPIPPYTNSVLDTLAANCVKATYFLVGEMAQLRPYLVRRIYNEGHSIGTHSQTHPFAFQRLSMARVEREVDGGIASVDNALGDPTRGVAVFPYSRLRPHQGDRPFPGEQGPDHLERRRRHRRLVARHHAERAHRSAP